MDKQSLCPYQVAKHFAIRRNYYPEELNKAVTKIYSRFNSSFQNIRSLGILVMSYLAAAVVYVCLEQPLASLEALTYRKPTNPPASPKSDLKSDENQAKSSENNVKSRRKKAKSTPELVMANKNTN